MKQIMPWDVSIKARFLKIPVIQDQVLGTFLSKTNSSPEPTAGEHFILVSISFSHFLHLHTF